MPARSPAGARLTVDVVATPADRAAVRGLATWLTGTAPRRVRGAVAIAVLSDRAVRTLNRRYRGVDRPTDVLSFRSGDSPAVAAPASNSRSGTAAARPSVPSPETRDLGEIAIARGVAARQAWAHGHSVATEVRVLALHGLLHLLGYDHEQDHGRMARVEARLRRQGGLPVGLIERARGGAGPRGGRHHG